MKIRKGTLVTSTFTTGADGEFERGTVTENCQDADRYAVRVRFEGDNRCQWVSREELIIHRKFR